MKAKILSQSLGMDDDETQRETVSAIQIMKTRGKRSRQNISKKKKGVLMVNPAGQRGCARINSKMS